MSCIPVEVAQARATTNSTRAISLPLRISPVMWRFGLLAISAWTALIAALLSLYIQPSLRIHDEFSYRLAAETLLLGRLANPTPPAWEALQSFHIILQPNYTSKYPLGTAIVTAVGYSISGWFQSGWFQSGWFQSGWLQSGWLQTGSLQTGSPHVGSWLAAALLASAATWMLASVLPKRWALLGGLIVSLHPFLQLAWSQSLLHGSLAAAGCALLTGGALRMRRRVQLSSAMFSGCGVAVLALSRPFEGLCCTAICGVWLLLSWNRFAVVERFKMTLRAAIYSATPVGLALVLIAAHNQASTGIWKQMPYQLHELQYAVAPVFVFSQPDLANVPPRADVPLMFQKFHAIDSLNWFLGRAGWSGWQRGLSDASGVLFVLAFPFALVVPFSGTRWLRYRVPQAVCLAIAIQIALSSCVVWVYAHYLAVLLPWLLLVSLVALRTSMQGSAQNHANNQHVKRPVKQYGNQRRIVAAVISGTLVVQVVSLIVFARIGKEIEATTWAHRRQEIEHQLGQAGGKHLIMVRYDESHNVHQEWVYNSADPLNSRIVWARNENSRWTDEVLKHYSADRTVWELEPDAEVVLLRPFAQMETWLISEQIAKDHPGQD